MEIFCRLQDIFLLLQGRVSSQKIDYFVLDSNAESPAIQSLFPEMHMQFRILRLKREDIALISDINRIIRFDRTKKIKK